MQTETQRAVCDSESGGATPQDPTVAGKASSDGAGEAKRWPEEGRRAVEVISNESVFYHCDTMPLPGSPLRYLQLLDISVPLKIPRVDTSKCSAELSRSQELFPYLLFLLPLWIFLGLDYYVRQPISMVRILREAIRRERFQNVGTWLQEANFSVCLKSE